MTVPQSSATDASLSRDVAHAALYYLRNRWTLIALAAIGIALGLSFGGWGWLVAAGLAPIILSTLPCLIMCAFGVCAMCASNKAQTKASGAAADPASSAAATGLANSAQPAIGGASCCGGGAAEPKPSEIKQIQSATGKEETHA